VGHEEMLELLRRPPRLSTTPGSATAPGQGSAGKALRKPWFAFPTALRHRQPLFSHRGCWARRLVGVCGTCCIAYTVTQWC